MSEKELRRDIFCFVLRGKKWYCLLLMKII